jgi:Family of unknown function (DUF5941)
MSSAAAYAARAPVPPDPALVLRDDGPLARALGRVGAALPVPAPVLAFLALAPVLVVAIAGGSDFSLLGAAAVLAWVLVVGGASSGARGQPRMLWAATPLMRLTEYAALIWIVGLDGASAYPAAYALIAALTFRHYDPVYRLRHSGVPPAPWVNALSLGWEGRLVAVYLLLVLGLVPAGVYALAAVLGAAFAAEAVYGWVFVGRVEPSPLGEQEDNE